MRHNAEMNTTGGNAQAEEFDFAQKVMAAEASAIQAVAIGEAFHQAVDVITAVEGRLVVCGLGKSGLIGQKLSATFASTGTPSHFLHPVEALHGDLGRVHRGDAVLALSYSGNTEEVVTLAELVRLDGVPVVSIAKGPDCGLGRVSVAVVSIGDVAEACPLNLAPTASTAAMLAVGDALALSVARRRGFGVQDFHKLHPGGGLGRQLMRVVDAMRFKAGENMPVIREGTTVADAYQTAHASSQSTNLRRPGALLVVDQAGKLTGLVTDGDLRSALIRSGPEVWKQAIDLIMSKQPTVLSDTATVRDAVHIVRTRRFDEIPVTDRWGKPLGMIDIQDLAALKVIEG